MSAELAITAQQRTEIRRAIESGDGVFLIADEPVMAVRPSTILALLDALDAAEQLLESAPRMVAAIQAAAWDEGHRIAPSHANPYRQPDPFAPPRTEPAEESQ